MWTLVGLAVAAQLMLYFPVYDRWRFVDWKRLTPAVMIAYPPRDINRVAICIATMSRPKGLTRLLSSITKLQFRRHPTPERLIVVCDNDPDQSAATSVARFSLECTLNVRYVNEPQRGISFARNACIRSALEAGADAVAFIDDDETPDPDRLDDSRPRRRRFQAHVVTGPVSLTMKKESRSGRFEAGFFERPTMTRAPRRQWLQPATF